MVPGSSMGRPMGTAQGRPGTHLQSSLGRPPPSSRMRGNLTSSSGTQAAQGVALATEVNVSDRPVTQGGLRGIKTGQGPSRQVQDASFYIGLLRQKVTEITAEIGVLKTEVTEHNRGAANYGQLQKRHEQLLGEVRQLEGTLADYNLAMDKHRVSTDPAELNDYINEFEAKNKQFAAEVDRVFMTKKHHDGQTQQLEEKIRELEPDKHQRYHQLLEHSHGLRSQLEGMQAELENVSAQVREGEGEGDAKSYKEEFAA